MLKQDQDRKYYNVQSCLKGWLHRCDENLALLGRSEWPSARENDLRLQPIVDAIASIKEEMLRHICEVDGVVLDDPNVRQIWILGVPAIWSESQQQELLNCATKAGLEHVWRGSEPDAMAQTFFQHRGNLKANSAIPVPLLNLL